MEQAIYWMVGGVGMPFIQWLKDALGLEGKPAVWLTVGVSIVLALVALLVSKDLTWGDFSPERILGAFGQILAGATLAYKLLRG